MKTLVLLTVLAMLAGTATAATPTGPLVQQDAQWGPDVRLTSNTYSDANFWSSQRRVVTDAAGRVHVTWYVMNSALGTPLNQVYYKRYSPGFGWSQDTMISADRYAAESSYNKNPAVALDSAGRVYVAWANGMTGSATQAVYVKSCLPTGTGNDGWDSVSVRLSASGPTYVKECPSVACTPNGHVHVVWREQAPSAGQYIAYRTKMGNFWQPQVNLDSNSYYKVYPSIAGTRDNRVHVAWHGYGPGSTSYYQVWYKSRPATGGMWDTTENVSQGVRHQMYPCIAGNPAMGWPHIVWQGYEPSGSRYRVIHSYRTPSQWEPRDTVSEAGSTYQQGTGQVTFDLNGYGYAVWTGLSAARPTIYQVRYSERASSGTWSPPVNLTDTTSTRDRPSICTNLSTETELDVCWADRRDGNDEIYVKRGSFTERHDVGVTRLLAPSGLIDSGSLVTPACSLYNYGTVVENGYSVRLYVYNALGPPLYDQSVVVMNHAVGEARFVTFPAWTALPRGAFAVRCTTMLSSDQTDSNNLRTGSGRVVVHSTGTVSVVAPSGIIPPGLVTPVATVFNNGTDRESMAVVFRINATLPYVGVVNLPAGLPFADTTLMFPDWSAIPGDWVGRCSTALAGEQLPGDDTVSLAFSVTGTIDVGVVQIVAPLGTIDTGTYVVPVATVRNFADGAQAFTAVFTIRSGGNTVYFSRKAVGRLGPGEARILPFDDWLKPHPAGTYVARCSTYLAFDGNRFNDTAAAEFTVVATPEFPWIEKSPVPAVPSGKAAKDGAWLSYDPSTDLIYASKGYKAADFYSYRPAVDSWRILSPMPPGREAKPPAKGGCGSFSGKDGAFAVKGNNTAGFYRYYGEGDSWRQLADIPLGSTNKKVKGGGDVVFVESRGTQGSVYLLKGYMNEFYRYDVAEDSWIALPGAPLGTTSFRYDKGSWLVYDGAQTILAHKSKYHELFGFDIMTDSWMIKHYSGMPYVGSSGRSKKSKDGGSATWLGDAVYALKGGNTQEFWQYRPSRDSWRERDSLPSVGSTGKKKKVKAGGDLAAVITGTIYGLKGNKTYEFWQYLKPGLASDAAPEAREGVLAAEAGRPAPAAGYVFPNPVRAGRSTIKLRGLTAGWAKGPVRLSLLDASGRLLRSGVTGPDSEVELALPAGVYVVRLAGAGTTCTRKLVVQR